MARRGQIRKLAAEFKVTDFLNHMDYLQALYGRAKASIPNYNYLAFAEDLGFPPTNALRLIAFGKRSFSPKAAERIASALALRGLGRRYLILLAKYSSARLPEKREKMFAELLSLKSASLTDVNQQTLEYFSAWQNPVIRELVGNKEFVNESEWVASRLYFKILPKEVRKSIELLYKLGLIKQHEDTFVTDGGQIRNNREVGDMAAVRYHQKMIEIARESITLIPEQRRDINAITLSISDATAELIKKKISELCEQALDIEKAHGNADQVYQLNIQFFPFTKPKRATEST